MLEWRWTNFYSQGKCYVITSKMIYQRGGGGKPEGACIADLLFCHGTQPWIIAGFVTVCCSMSMVSKTVCAAISAVKKPTTLHTCTLGLNFTMKSWAESLALMSVIIIHGPHLKQTQLLCMIWRYRLWAACPCLSYSVVAFTSME